MQCCTVLYSTAVLTQIGSGAGRSPNRAYETHQKDGCSTCPLETADERWVSILRRRSLVLVACSSAQPLVQSSRKDPATRDDANAVEGSD